MDSLTKQREVAFVAALPVLGRAATQRCSSVSTCHARRPRKQRPRVPSMVWVERAADVIVEASATDAFDSYIDLEAMPKWSPWLKRVTVDKTDGDVSYWTLGARGLEFSWRARNTEVERGRIIQWQSETGLANRGRVDFTPVEDEKTRVRLGIEFDVPDAVASVIRNEAIGRFVESTLREDLKRFRTVCLSSLRRKRASTRPAGAE